MEPGRLISALPAGVGAAALATPAGASGAVLLRPVRVWPLGLAMGGGAPVGALLGMATVGRLPAEVLRRLVEVIALLAALWHTAA